MPDIRIISEDEWAAAQAHWKEIDGVLPSKKGRRGFEGKRKSYVESHPTHLLSVALKCGSCCGAIALTSGKGSGYYGASTHRAILATTASRLSPTRSPRPKNG